MLPVVVSECAIIHVVRVPLVHLVVDNVEVDIEDDAEQSVAAQHVTK